jgi:hypothetical protein
MTRFHRKLLPIAESSEERIETLQALFREVQARADHGRERDYRLADMLDGLLREYAAKSKALEALQKK